MRGYFRLRPSQVSHPPPSLSISLSLSLLCPPPPRPTAARPTAHQNDNSIDVKCVAFGPLKHITPACLAQPPPHFMALLCPLLCPPLLGWADNNLENSLYTSPRVGQRSCVCRRVCTVCVSGSISQGATPKNQRVNTYGAPPPSSSHAGESFSSMIPDKTS